MIFGKLKQLETDVVSLKIRIKQLECEHPDSYIKFIGFDNFKCKKCDRCQLIFKYYVSDREFLIEQAEHEMKLAKKTIENSKKTLTNFGEKNDVL